MATPIRALFFDFDGLILDTETPELDVWRRIYSEYGFTYSQDLWTQNVGLWGHSVFDPVAHLHELTHDSFDMQALRKRHHDESTVLIEQEPVRPGVLDYLTAARSLGLGLAVASSSPREWVVSHLTRLGLVDRFDRIITAENVAPGRTKPYPDIYLAALAATGVEAGQAIAFEDSPPGASAAHSAGIFTVAVANPTTAVMKIEHADLQVDSLASLPLAELLQRAAPAANNLYTD